MKLKLMNHINLQTSTSSVSDARGRRPKKRNPAVCVLFCALLVGTVPLLAQEEPAANAATTEIESGTGSNLNPKPGAMIVVQGAAGESEFGEQFSLWATAWCKAADGLGLELHRIGLDKKSVSDRQQLQGQIDEAKNDESSPLWIVLIGHGTYLNGNAKFNLVGRDISAAELAEWLKPLQRPISIVNCASASGPFLTKLSSPNRVLVTATQSGDEFNFARFGKYLSEAITAPTSDIDHDGTISLLEAFLNASRGTLTFYKEESRLATEHALLDDNGDAAGTSADFFEGINVATSAQDGKQVDGASAHSWVLHRLEGAVELSAEASRERDRLESQLADLRKQKTNLPTEQYFEQLEPIVLAIAQLYEHASVPAPE